MSSERLNPSGFPPSKPRVAAVSNPRRYQLRHPRDKARNHRQLRGAKTAAWQLQIGAVVGQCCGGPTAVASTVVVAGYPLGVA